jgi:hypothetical protein
MLEVARAIAQEDLNRIPSGVAFVWERNGHVRHAVLVEVSGSKLLRQGLDSEMRSNLDARHEARKRPLLQAFDPGQKAPAQARASR